MQAEIIESLIKDRDRVNNEFNKLRSDIGHEVQLLYRQVMDSSLSSSYDPSDWSDQIKMIKR